MTDSEANDIVENALKAHWPNWTFAAQELRVWIEELRRYEHDTVRDAINDLYKTWDKDRYPRMPRILKAIREYTEKKKSGGNLVKHFDVLKPDGTLRYLNGFWGSSLASRQFIERCAEKVRDRCNDLYGDGHIIAYYKIDDDVPI